MDGMRPITNPKLEIMDYVKKAWYFDKIHEKLILVVLCGLGIFKIIEWILI